MSEPPEDKSPCCYRVMPRAVRISNGEKPVDDSRVVRGAPRPDTGHTQNPKTETRNPEPGTPWMPETCDPNSAGAEI